MNNYYQPQTCTDIDGVDDVLKLINGIIKYKTKVKVKGEIYFLTKNEFSQTSFFTLSLSNGEALQVFLKKDLTEQLDNLSIIEGTVVSVTGNISLYRFREKPPIIQIYASEITKEHETFSPRANYPEKQDFKRITKLNKIAVISNENSRGYKDFISGLPKYFQNNEYACKLYHTDMEGSYAATGIINAIERINNQKPEYRPDVICIVRGGSDKYTLSYVFDNKSVCDAVINSQIPVLTGIGHYSDYMQIDKVADFPVLDNERQYCGTPSQLARLISRINYQLRHPEKNNENKPYSPTKYQTMVGANKILSAAVVILLIYIWLFT